MTIKIKFSTGKEIELTEQEAKELFAPIPQLIPYYPYYPSTPNYPWWQPTTIYSTGTNTEIK